MPLSMEPESVWKLLAAIRDVVREHAPDLEVSGIDVKQYRFMGETRIALELRDPKTEAKMVATAAAAKAI